LSLPVLGCYYRADLLARAGLEPPRTWSDYDRLVATRAEWAPGLSAVEPRAPQWTVTLLLARAAAYVRHPESLSTLFDISNGEPLIHEPAYVRALDEWLRLGPQLAPAASQADPARCRELLLAGQAALAIAAEPGRGPVPFPFGPVPTGKPADADGTTKAAPESAAARPAGAKFGCVPLPGAKEAYNRATRRWDTFPGGSAPRPSLAGFAGLCAGIAADTPAEIAPAAWNLLGLLLSPDAPAPFPPGTRTACWATDAGAALGWLAPGLKDDETGSVLAAILESGNDPLLVPELAVVGRDEFRSALQTQIAAAVEGRLTADRALRAAADEWGTIARRLGLDRIRDAARRTAGLAPLR
jgi:ABC-type glycerol-3-phosphate transport system substrate-binding protein